MEATRLNKPLKALTFAMVFLGVGSVLLTGCLAPPQPLIVIVLLVIGLFLWESKIHTRIYVAVWYVLTLLFLGWCCRGFFVARLLEEELIGRIPIAAMQLSIFLQLFKVYNAKRDRDYAHMFLLSFFQFVSCAGVSVEFHVLPLLLVYLVVGMSALTLFHFRRQLETPEASVAAPVVAITGRVRSARLLTVGFFTGTLVISVLAAAVAAFLFVFVPRSAASDNPLILDGFFRSLGRRFVTGSSGMVDLNLAGIISRNPMPVMSVSFPSLKSPLPSPLWRRAALHQYDGKTMRWIRPFGRHSGTPGGSRGTYKSVVNVLIQKSPGLFLAASEFDKYNSLEDLKNDPQLVAQEYRLLVGYTRAPIFSAFSSPVAVRVNVPSIICDVNESFYCDQRTWENFRYTVFSRMPTRGPNGGLADPTGSKDDWQYEAMVNFYTQLSSNRNPRFESLARQITEPAPTDYDKARAIQTYLTMHCRYSLDLTREPGRNGPLYDFLFEGKPGHCEYFASAMVILLRELGIPCRLAHGYSSGEWDEERKAFVVRQLDAHAWAEVYIKGRGWTPFDPTPVVADDEEPQTFLSILFQPVTSFFNYCEALWTERVIEYTRFRQRAIFRSVATTLKNGWEGIKEYVFTIKFTLSQLWKRISEDVFLRLFAPVATVSVLLALAVGGTIRAKRRGKFGQIYRKQQLPRRTGLRVKFYEKMLRLLMDKGISKAVADTPLEFADRIVSASRPFSGVKTLTDLYYFVRFGHGKLTPEQSRTVQSILQRLGRLVPPRKPIRPGG